jgi:hypothetical protein
MSLTPAGRWTTPRLLQAALAAVWLAALLFLLASLAGVRQARQALQTVGRDAVPSILLAQRLKVSLSDLDANVVNELMVPPGRSASSIKGYDERREEITTSLIRAAENITYGDAERKPITDLTNSLSLFERLATRARTLHERGALGADAAYRDALAVLHTRLLPAADALRDANSHALQRASDGHHTARLLNNALLMVAALLLLGALAATQLFLSHRMRRTLNPVLLAATCVAGFVLVRTLGALDAAAEDLRVAKQDAFQSLSALWQARALAYDANSDESRWLFDRNRRPELEKAFFDKTGQLLRLPGGQSYDAVVAATSADSLPTGASGFFADELNNITFAGERDAATRMVHAYGVYYKLDQRIRALEHAGQHDEAVRFCISMAPGDSNWAYSQFDNALEATIDINQKAFDEAIARGFQHLRGYDLLAPVGAFVIALLAFFGLRPRLREYDV